MKNLNWKKKILLGAIMSFSIMAVSKVAFSYNSDWEDYSAELPRTGSQTISPVIKTISGGTAFNRITYVDSNDRIEFWVTYNGEKISPTSYGSGTGTKYVYYGNPYSWYMGNPVGLTEKTGPLVYHKIFVQGTFQP